MPLTAETRTYPTAVVGAPTAAFIIAGVRMLYVPVLDSPPVTLFVETRK